MCGIVAVLRRRARRAPPAPGPIAEAVAAALALVPEREVVWPRLHEVLSAAAAQLETVDAQLQGPSGVQCLLAHQDLAARLHADLTSAQARIERIEGLLDAGAAPLPTAELEALNATLIRTKDAAWSVQRDRLRTARAVAELAGQRPSRAAVEACTSIQVALSALDRLEVRGRDSAGLHLLVTGHGLDLQSREVQTLLGPRVRDRLFTSLAARVAGGHLAFVYKHAAEIGELGDNVRALRAAVTGDPLLRLALRAEGAEAVVVAHTRWASVGIVSEPNAHPLNQEELDGAGTAASPYVIGVLNGDVDNHAELAATERIHVAEEITTDAKVIPVLVARRLVDGRPLDDAFRRTVASFVGSVAIAAHSASAPGRLLLALRGSGQALYVGLAEDAYVVASEPYGLVETTRSYLRMDGETPGNPADPAASQGQVIALAAEHAGTVEGITRLAYDGTPLPVRASSFATAAMTTRDIDRGEFPHFLLKEITESPRSLQKTLRGRIVAEGGRLAARLGPESIPPAVAAALRAGHIRQVVVIGQGTAAVAGQGIAAMVTHALAALPLAQPLTVTAMPATELSGFHLREDMGDTLVLAISQSGTTTDTNRTVDLVRARGATVLAIVNRRGSDLCDKSDGVLFTSDGRDVEMSVASTKAFYAQIAAGTLLAFALARAAAGRGSPDEHELLTALRSLPEAMRSVLGASETIARIARTHAPSRRYWAVVGNGPNRVSAQEVRIKLSELCYKSIACDATEDKKHIDLSSEPLILVCATGLEGSTADDVAKEVAIYRAHKAAPIVIASDGDAGYAAALAVIRVPAVHQKLAFVLAAVAGHLFGYHAALAIDALARPLRALRGVIEDVVGENAVADDAERLLAVLRPRLAAAAGEFFALLESRACDGQLEARTAVRIASLLRYATGITPLESFAIEHGRPGTPAVVIDALTEALTRGIEELTRPIDAIKHQAKTVTVGISRSDEALVTAPLVKATLAAGAPRDRIQYRDLRALAALSPAVAEVTGFTRYRLHGDDLEHATVEVVGSGGIARTLTSRVAANPGLRGTKHMVANERQVFVARGRSDDRTVILVPEVAGQHCTGITLLHVRFRERLGAEAMRGALAGYRQRFTALKDAVTETEPQFRDEPLEQIPVVDLLTMPVHNLADRWKH